MSHRITLIGPKQYPSAHRALISQLSSFGEREATGQTGRETPAFYVGLGLMTSTERPYDSVLTIAEAARSSVSSFDVLHWFEVDFELLSATNFKLFVQRW